MGLLPSEIPHARCHHRSWQGSCHHSAVTLALLPVGNERDRGGGEEKGVVWLQQNMEQEGACAEISNRIGFGHGELLFKIYEGTEGQSHSSPRI